MVGIRWALRAGFLPLLAACGGGTSRDASGDASRLQVLSLDAPESAALRQRLPVRVLVADRVGIEAVELRLGEVRQEVRATGGRFAALATDVVPVRNGVLVLEAVARGVDGVRGAPARVVIVVGDERSPTVSTMDAATLGRRVTDWNRRGLHEDEAYARGPLYVGPPVAVPLLEDWWVHWMEEDGPQPFGWADHCDDATEVTPNGEVLRCWLDQNVLVAVSINWEKILPNGYVQDQLYPFWPESWKHELDVAFYDAYVWLASGLQAPWSVPPEPPTNQIPSSYYGSSIALTEAQARPLWMATVAFSLAVEIGGFVPWSILGYDPEDLYVLFNSHAMFHAGELEYVGLTYEGYWCFDVLPAHPKTTFRFFVDQDIVRPTHHSTIVRLLTWSGSNLAHYSDFGGDTDGKTPMQVAYMHWQYYGDAPVQRMLTGTIRENDSQVRHWTRGCTGTCPFYASILRALNVPVAWQFGWGEGIDPHLDGHTAPIFPTIGKALSHGDDMLAWNNFTDKVRPPPGSVSTSRLLISWDTFVDWFYTHPDHNVGRPRHDEIPIDVLTDEILELHCDDLAHGRAPAQSTVLERFSEHHTLSDLLARDLWTRLDAKVASLDACD